MQKNPKTFYNATDAAKYLGITRQRFYVVKEKHRIKKHAKGYAALDLSKVRALMDKWKAAHEKRV